MSKAFLGISSRCDIFLTRWCHGRDQNMSGGYRMHFYLKEKKKKVNHLKNRNQDKKKEEKGEEKGEEKRERKGEKGKKKEEKREEKRREREKNVYKCSLPLLQLHLGELQHKNFSHHLWMQTIQDQFLQRKPNNAYKS